MGRPATPPEQKAVMGTLRADRERLRHQPSASLPLLAHIPDPPAPLQDREYALDQWPLICEELHGLGMLRPTVIPFVAMYCLAIDDCFRFRAQAEAEQWVTQFQNEDGTPIRETVTQYSLLADRALHKAQSLLKLLCLDPATVRKLAPPAPPDKPKTGLRGLLENQ